jgi:hypothetical protein
MPVLLVAILNDPARIWEVLDAWNAVGVRDATIIDTIGLHKTASLRDDLPLFPSVADLLEESEAHRRMLWSVVADNVNLDAVARATEQVIGSLDAPETGLMFALPIAKAWGLRPPQDR